MAAASNAQNPCNHCIAFSQMKFDPLKLHPYHIPAFERVLQAMSFDPAQAECIMRLVLDKVMVDLVPKYAVQLTDIRVQPCSIVSFSLDGDLIEKFIDETAQTLEPLLPAAIEREKLLFPDRSLTFLIGEYPIDKMKMRILAAAVTILIAEYQYVYFNRDPDNTKPPSQRLAIRSIPYCDRQYIDTVFDPARLNNKRLNTFKAGLEEMELNADQVDRMMTIFQGPLMRHIMEKVFIHFLAVQLIEHPCDSITEIEEIKKSIHGQLCIAMWKLAKAQVPKDIQDKGMNTFKTLTTDIVHFALGHFSELQKAGQFALEEECLALPQKPVVRESPTDLLLSGLMIAANIAF